VKILIVEDDPIVAESLNHLLASYAYAVDIATDAEVGLELVEAYDYDLLVLDVILPGMDGLSFCQQLRTQQRQMPILLLTGQGGEGHQQAEALNAGADDYVVKPFDSEELIARLQALLRRRGGNPHPVLTWGHLSLDPSSRRVTYNDQLLSLTPKEYGILELLLRNPQTTFSARAVLDHAWESIDTPGEEVVRYHIKELRHKLANAAAPKNLIQTLHRVGYRLNPMYSSLVANQTEQQPTPPQIAELTATNQQLRTALEELRTAQEKLQQENLELRASRDALEAEQQRYQDLFEFAPDGYLVTDCHGNIEVANRAAAVLLGTEPQALLHKPLSIFIPTSERQDFQTRLTESAWPLNQEVTLQPCQGEPIPVLVAVTTITDAQQQVTGLRWSLRDIRDRKHLQQQDQTVKTCIEQKVSERTAELQALYDQAPCSYHALDENGVFIQINDNGLKMLGYRRKDLLGKRFTDFLAPDSVATFEENFPKFKQRGWVKDLELHILHRDGSTLPVSLNAKAVYDDAGDYLMSRSVMVDISDRKQAEAQLRQQIRQEYLLADIAQDIRRSLQLDHVLSRTVNRVRQWLDTDRVIIFRFRPDWQGDVITESVGEGWLPLLSTTFADPCFEQHYIEPYRQGHVSVMTNIDEARLNPCYVELLAPFQVKAYLAVPILQGEQLWGLLIAHHCSAPRQWQSAEIAMVRRLATQVGIAIHQSELYEQIQRDLFAREQMQAVLEENEERFRTLSATAPVGIVQTTPEGTCLYTNAHWQAISGLTLDASLGEGWLQAIHPADRQKITQAWHTYLHHAGEFHQEFRLLTPQGDSHWISARANLIQTEAGATIGHVCVLTDISRQKLNAQKIAEQSTLLDIASDAIVVRDLDHRILYWNQGAERLYGWRAAEAIGQPIEQLLQWDPKRRSKITQILLTQGEWSGELQGQTQTGRSVIVAARHTLVRDEAGQPKSILSVITDITEKKQLEAQFYQAQRMESLGHLASGIAHDLNNVFTPILTLAQVLRLTQRQLTPKGQEQLRLLEESTKRGANLVKQVLAITRGSSGERTAVNLIAVLEEVVTMAQQSLPKSIKIQPHCLDQDAADPPLGMVFADPTQLHQVFMNLCINARDAMPEGGSLTMSAQNTSVDRATAQKHLQAKVGPYVVVTVADTGVGMDPAVRDRIFDPFFTTKEPGKGTGLGLSTVFSIVKNTGGFLQVFTQVGRGTTMKVFLPAMADPAEENSATTESAPEASSTQSNGDGELILVVDDDEIVQQTIQSMLETHHYTPQVASDGVEALELYQRHRNHIRLVVLDINMPYMGGIELIQRLKSINPAVNIIAISGLPANQESSLKAGANVFLSKPYSLETFIAQVENLLAD
jgi:PAS domain S-box-containing protein